MDTPLEELFIRALLVLDDDPEERSTDEINEDVRQALASLDGSRLATVALLTGIPVEKLIELGGIDEAAAAEEERDGQAVSLPGPADAPGGETR